MMDAQGILDIAELEPGQELETVTLDLDTTAVASYLEAVEHPPLADGIPLVPGMAVAALALRSLLTRLRLPPGTLHTGQELQFYQEPKLMEPLICRTRVAQKSPRARLTIVAIDLHVTDDKGHAVLDATSSLVIPSQGHADATP